MAPPSIVQWCFFISCLVCSTYICAFNVLL